jgi:thiamine transporter ThiT
MTALGWLLSLIPAGMLSFGASLKFLHKPELVEMFVSQFGWRESMFTGLGILELAVALVYLLPRTAVLGGILVTGYLGGAVATHVRVADPGAGVVLALGILAWSGLYLRDGRIRQLIPLRNPG